MTMERDYYLPSEIMPLVRRAGKSKTGFYEQVKKGGIEKVIRDNREAYNKRQVDAFLASRSRTPGRRKGTGASKQVPESGTAQGLVIDVAQESDLLPLYTLESDQLDFLRAIVPPVLHAWQQVNDHTYWLLFHPTNRQEILAMLGVLPLREAVIQQLLRKELSPAQISASDVLPYKSGESYSCYITSAATEPGYREAILSLVELLFSYWCEQSISIEALYASVPEDTDDNIPLLRIVTGCFFSLLNEEDQWRLRPLRRKYHPVEFIRNYQRCLQQDEAQQKGGDVPMHVIEPSPARSLEGLRRLFEKKLSRRGDRDFTEIINAFFEIGTDGHISRKDGVKQHEVWVGRIRGDDDIRATLRINASLFGPSKRYAEDQLVDFRRAWLKKNPDIYRVLEVDGEVVGYIFAIPLPKSVIDRVLADEIRVGDIAIEDLQAYRPGQPVDIYLQTLGVHKRIQGGEKFIAGMYLIAGMQHLFTDLAERRIEIRSIYTRSAEPDGIKLCAALGFEEIPAPTGVEKMVLQLDFSKEKNSLRAYKHVLDLYKSRHSVEENIES